MRSSAKNLNRSGTNEWHMSKVIILITGFNMIIRVIFRSKPQIME